MGGLILDLSKTFGAVWSGVKGVMVKPPGDRKPASFGFACSCAARSAPCCKVPPPAEVADEAGGGRLLPVIGAEFGFSKIASEVPGVGFGEGTVSAVGMLPVLGVDIVIEGVVVEPTDSSSSLSNADIDKLLGMPVESPASRRDLRSFPNELLRRGWGCVA